MPLRQLLMMNESNEQACRDFHTDTAASDKERNYFFIRTFCVFLFPLRIYPFKIKGRFTQVIFH
jgi:hypothetical protein